MYWSCNWPLTADSADVHETLKHAKHTPPNLCCGSAHGAATNPRDGEIWNDSAEQKRHCWGFRGILAEGRTGARTYGCTAVGSVWRAAPVKAYSTTRAGWSTQQHRGSHSKQGASADTSNRNGIDGPGRYQGKQTAPSHCMKWKAVACETARIRGPRKTLCHSPSAPKNMRRKKTLDA